MYYEPRLLHSFLAALPVPGLALLVEYVNSPVVKSAASMLGAMALVFAVGLFANWMVYNSVNHLTRLNEAKAITPQTRALELARSLTAEQCKLVPVYEPRVKIGVIPGRDDSQMVVIGPGGSFIPYDAVIKILGRSGVTYLQSIRETSDGTPEREHLQAFTWLMVELGFALPAVGPKPAQWVTENSKSQVAHMLGIELPEVGYVN